MVKLAELVVHMKDEKDLAEYQDNGWCQLGLFLSCTDQVEFGIKFAM